MKTYERYAVIRVPEGTFFSVSLDTIKTRVKKNLETAGWPVDKAWVEDAIEDKED